MRPRNRDLGAEYQQGIFDMLRGAKDFWLKSGMGLLNPNNPVYKRTPQPKNLDEIRSLLDEPDPDLEYLPSLDPGGFMRGMTKVFHGSPHLFKNWNFKKMGSGEGAQAYGHGGYFAGSKGIGQHYVDMLSDPNPSYLGVPVKERLNQLFKERDQFLSSNPSFSIPENLEKSKKIDYEIGKLQFLQELTEKFRKQSALGEPSFDQFLKNEIELSKNYSPLFEQTKKKTEYLKDLEPGQISLDKTGHLYEIELRPDPEDFLDWSQSLSDQSPSIKTKLNKFFDKYNKTYFKNLYDDWQNYLDDLPEEAQTIAKKFVADEIPITDSKTWTRMGELAPDADHNMIHNYRDYAFGFGGHGITKMTGEDFFRKLEDVMGVEQAAKILSSEGIPGHRFLDGMSRSGKKPQKNYNYVVYPTDDPDMIKITNPPQSLLD